MKARIPALLCLGALLSGPACARDAPLVNPADIPVAWSKDRQPTIDEIVRAIVKGCSRRGWQCGFTRIFSIAYVDSRELRYDPARNEIHHKYNGWVNNLVAASP